MGQTKGSGERHEKDDRSRLDDRGRYVLSWSNEAKIKALEAQAPPRGGDAGQRGRDSENQREQGVLRDKLGSVRQLEDYADWIELDWRPLSLRVAALEAEKKELESAGDVLKSLAAKLAQVESELKSNEAALDENRREEARTDEKREQALALREESALIVEQARAEVQAEAYPASRSWPPSWALWRT